VPGEEPGGDEVHVEGAPPTGRVGVLDARVPRDPGSDGEPVEPAQDGDGLRHRPFAALLGADVRAHLGGGIRVDDHDRRVMARQQRCKRRADPGCAADDGDTQALDA